jgi:hypothetical protein
MRTAILSLLFIVGVTATAQARLGETPDQLVARYGQPLSEADQKAEGIKVALAAVVFQKGGFEVDVTVVDGVSVQEVFKKINGGPLTNGEVKILLNANSQGLGWEAPDKTQDGGKLWKRDDNATAFVSPDGTLTIKSRDLAVKEAVAKKQEKTPSLEGF